MASSPANPEKQRASVSVRPGKLACRLALGWVMLGAAWPALGLDWSFKAFGTLAAIGTDTDDIGFRRDYTQTKGATTAWGIQTDSRLGLQLDATVGQEFYAAVQWVARNHAGNFFEQNLDWAFVRWRPREDLELRLGRLGFDAFLLSDYRNVGYAYPWMRPPSDFYSPLFTYHFDGADVTRKIRLGDGDLSFKAYVGHSNDDTLAQQPGATVATLEMALFGGNIVYESGDWRARIGYTHLTPLQDLPVSALHAAFANPQVQAAWPGYGAIFDSLSITGKQLHFSAIGCAYDDGVWPIQAEAAYISSDIAWLPDIGTAYLSLGRRVGKLTLYSLSGLGQSAHYHVSVPQPLVLTPALSELENRVDYLLNSNGVDQVSTSLGVRWDVHEKIALKAQWSHFWLGKGGTLYWLELKPTLPDNVNVWSFGVDFIY